YHEAAIPAVSNENVGTHTQEEMGDPHLTGSEQGGAELRGGRRFEEKIGGTPDPEGCHGGERHIPLDASTAKFLFEMGDSRSVEGCCHLSEGERVSVGDVVRPMSVTCGGAGQAECRARDSRNET